MAKTSRTAAADQAPKPPAKRRRSTAPHVPSQTSRAQVQVLAAFNMPQPDIADYLRIDDKTLRKYYRSELTQSRSTLKAQIGQQLADFAFGRKAQYDERGNRVRDEIPADRAVTIFLGKTVLGLRETIRIGGDEEGIPITIKLTREETRY